MRPAASASSGFLQDAHGAGLAVERDRGLERLVVHAPPARDVPAGGLRAREGAAREREVVPEGREVRTGAHERLDREPDRDRDGLRRVRGARLHPGRDGLSQAHGEGPRLPSEPDARDDEELVAAPARDDGAAAHRGGNCVRDGLQDARRPLRGPYVSLMRLEPVDVGEQDRDALRPLLGVAQRLAGRREQHPDRGLDEPRVLEARELVRQGCLGEERVRLLELGRLLLQLLGLLLQLAREGLLAPHEAGDAKPVEQPGRRDKGGPDETPEDAGVSRHRPYDGGLLEHERPPAARAPHRNPRTACGR